MKITRVDTYLANAGLRNYLFLRVHTDTGVYGVGEASLEWQEKTVETVLHEWVIDRVIGRDPFDIESVVGGLLRDQYQGGSTVLTAISGVELALWDIIGKVCGQPVYRLLGGRVNRQLPAYANGWYGGARSAAEYAELARDAVARGYRALKFDPFGVAWKDLQDGEAEHAEEMVARIREAVGPHVDLMIEYHGRLRVETAIATIKRLDRFRPAWSEEPVAPESIDLLAEVKRNVNSPIAAGERLYALPDFYRLCALRAADIVQMDIAHCGGLWTAKKIAAIAAVQDLRVAPHCSIGPVALAAALHFDASTPNFMVQEAFAEFDVPWRTAFVCGWQPVREGAFLLDDRPGLGIDIDEEVIADHPYVKNAFPSLWDGDWITNFKQDERESPDDTSARERGRT